MKVLCRRELGTKPLSAVWCQRMFGKPSSLEPFMLVDSCIGEMLIFVSKALEKNLTMVHLAKETAHWLKTKNNRLSLTSVLIINYYVNYFGDELMNRISKELSFLSLDLKTGHHFKLTGKKNNKNTSK